MNYVTLDEAIELHDEIIELFGGKGGYNQVNIGYLASALDQIKNDTFYPTILEKVGHLMFSCIKFHPFLDGNKRTSIHLANFFLEFNDISIEDFSIKMEDVVVDVAENKIDKNELLQILKQFLEEV